MDVRVFLVSIDWLLTCHFFTVATCQRPPAAVLLLLFCSVVLSFVNRAGPYGARGT